MAFTAERESVTYATMALHQRAKGLGHSTARTG